MATRQDLITLVLENLGVLAAGQSASAEDRDLVNRRIDPKIVELARREVVTGLSADTLDDAVLLYIGDIIAYACRTPFGIVGAKADLLSKAAAEAESALKGMARQLDFVATGAAYDVTQDVLEQLGVVSPGQVPSAQDRGVVSARIAPMLADLRQREIIAFTDLAGADAAHRRHLATILVASCGPTFGVAGAALIALVEAARGAEAQLRALARQFDTGTGTSGTFAVAQSVLELLGVVEGGQTASSKDVAVVSARYAPLLADLRARHIADLPSVDGADASTKHYLAGILAARCALLFGVGEPALTGLRAEEMRAEAALRSIARQLDAGVGTGGTLDAPQSVLEILGVVAAGQSASAKDRAVVTTRLASIFADLANRQIITVSSFDAADASVQRHLVAITAAAVAPLFGIEPDRLQVIEAESARAESALRIISRQLDAGVATGGTFDLVQVTLENLGAVAVGRTATPKDRAIVSGRVTAVLDDLRQREVISIASLADAAPSTLLQLSVLLTSACAMAFGIPAEVRGQLRSEAERAEIALRAQARQLDAGSATSGTFDLPQAVLEALGVIDAGQTGSAKDRAVVSARVAPVLADLQAREIISIPNLGVAPDAVKVALSVVVTAACARAFQVQPAALVAFDAAAAKAENDLRTMARQFDVGTGTAGTYDLAQSVLEMLGVVAGGQTASAKDRAVVTARVPVLLADLRDRDVIALASIEGAADSTKLHLATLLASRCSRLFATPDAMVAGLKAEATEAEAALRRIARQVDTGSGTAGTFDVVQSVLETLGIVAGGQTGTAKDRSVVTARVAVTLADLRRREIIDLASLADSDAATLPHLAFILAARCAAPFGVEPALATSIKAEAAEAERALRLIARQLDASVGTAGTFDVVQATLEQIGIVEAGQTASLKDRSVVTARVAPMLADLRLRDVVAIGSIEAADPAALPHLAVTLAAWCAPAFGVPQAAIDALQSAGARAEAGLRTLARQFDTGTGTSGALDIAQSVLEGLGVVTAGQSATAKDVAVVAARQAPLLADLRAREIIDLVDIATAPAGTKPHLVTLLTATCAPLFGVAGAALDALQVGSAAATTALRLIARQLDAGVATSGTYDLVQSVLEMLGVVAGGQTASAKDRAVVTARIPVLLDDLRQRDVIDLASADGAAPATLLHLATLLARRCAVLFSAPDAMVASLRAEQEEAEAALRLIARQLDTGAGTSGTFDAVQAALEALGVVAAGQTASAKDRAVVSARVAPVLADLRNREILAIASLAAADAGTLVHLSVILAAACAEAFGVPAPLAGSLVERAARAEGALNAAARQLDTGTGTSGTFDAVQVVLETLGVIAPGQSGSAKDRATIEARVPVVLADLKAREVADVTTLVGASAAYQPSLATIIAAACAAAFQVPGEARTALVAAAGQAESALRRMARQFDAGAGTGDQFDAVQTVLETLGVVEAGQTATAKDRAAVMSRAAPMLADLRRRDIIDVASFGAADAGVQLHLAGVLASWCAGPFKVGGEVLATVKAGAAQAETALRLIGRQLDGGIATGGTFDVVQAVLENLGVVAAGYTGSAKDRAVVSARVAPMLADLRLREVVSIASLDAADPGVLIHLSVILTSACAQAFGKDAALRALLAAEATKAEAALKALARQLDTGTATSGAYDVAQATLEMLGVVEAGQTASDKDRAVVLARVQPKLMELYGRDICGVTDLSQLTPELQGAFARILAADCLLAFPAVPAGRVAMLQGMVPGAEQVLRYQSFVYDARPALRIEPFWGRRRNSSFNGMW